MITCKTIQFVAEQMSFDTNLIIGGGALRDLDHGLNPKDIDIFAKADEDLIPMYRKFFATWMEFKFTSEIGEYDNNFQERLFVVDNYDMSGESVQVIYLNPRKLNADIPGLDVRKQILKTFDFGINAIGAQCNRQTGKVEIFKSAEYKLDKEAKRICNTFSYYEREKIENWQRDQSIQRALRFQNKLKYNIFLNWQGNIAEQYEKKYVEPVLPQWAAAGANNVAQNVAIQWVGNWDIRPGAVNVNGVGF